MSVLVRGPKKGMRRAGKGHGSRGLADSLVVAGGIWVSLGRHLESR